MFYVQQSAFISHVYTFLYESFKFYNMLRSISIYHELCTTSIFINTNGNMQAKSMSNMCRINLMRLKIPCCENFPSQ